MRKLKSIIAATLALIMVLGVAQTAFARVGQIGFFGGITEGVPLRLTTETLLAQPTTGNQGNANFRNMAYAEMVWITGEPIEVTGTMTMTVSNAGGRNASATHGSRTVRYEISAENEEFGVTLSRDIRFVVNWRRVGDQIIETYSVERNNQNVLRWSETITIGDTVYTICTTRSRHEISFIRDITPGVEYYSGNISMRAVYLDDDENIAVSHYIIGEINGFESLWSSAETHRLDGIVSHTAGGWQMQYHLVPSVAVHKDLQFTQNEPTLTSFFGNYRELTINQSGLNYVIYVQPPHRTNSPTSGRATIESFNRFEQLIAPNLSHLRGHWAYGDIRRLFAIEVLTGNPHHFVPNQAVTRAEFMTMLARATGLPVDEAHRTPPAPPRNGRAVQVDLTFPDLWPNRPDYAYLRAINYHGIAEGRGDGHFHPDEMLSREEAFVLTLRMLGLSILGLDFPLTAFADSDSISPWAINDISAAHRIGLIAPDAYGYLHPQDYMTKAQAAALVNRLIDYMRNELMRDYTENIINFLN